MNRYNYLVLTDLSKLTSGKATAGLKMTTPDGTCLRKGVVSANSMSEAVLNLKHRLKIKHVDDKKGQSAYVLDDQPVSIAILAP